LALARQATPGHIGLSGQTGPGHWETEPEALPSPELTTEVGAWEGREEEVSERDRWPGAHGA
jgi:hypothetical protein